MYSRAGLINRLLIALILSNGLLFLNKSLFYEKTINELADEMTLTGQEARIQLRYHFPDHPLLGKLVRDCARYKELSEQKSEAFNEKVETMRLLRERERKKDAEFEERLRLLAQEEELEEEIKKDLPKFK